MIQDNKGGKGGKARAERAFNRLKKRLQNTYIKHILNENKLKQGLIQDNKLGKGGKAKAERA